MATQALDWLSLEDARFELRVAEQADVDSALLRYIRSAVAEVTQYTGLPLVDRTIAVDFVPTAGMNSVIVGPLMYPFAVEKVESWRGADYSESAPNVTHSVDSTTIRPLDPNRPRGMYVVEYSPGVSDTRFRLTLKVGVMPADFPHVSQAVILRVREMFEGHIQQPSGMAPLWQRVLADTGYWNAVDIEG